MTALSLGLRTPPHSIRKLASWTGVPGVVTHSLSALERFWETLENRRGGREGEESKQERWRGKKDNARKERATEKEKKE